MEEQIFFNPIKLLLLNSSMDIEFNRISYVHTRRMLTKEKRYEFRCGSFNKNKKEEEKEERKIAIVHRSNSAF